MDHISQRRLRDEARQVMAESECLYSLDHVESAITNLAHEVAQTLRDSDPLVLCVMLGGLMTTGMLATRLGFPVEIDYLHLGRYGDKTRGGELVWHREPSVSLEGRSVLLVDDILDEGNTLEALLDFCRNRGAEAVHSAVLVEKHHDRRRAGVRADFVGLAVEDRYVFGYGMDYKGHLRNMPGIFAVAQS